MKHSKSLAMAAAFIVMAVGGFGLSTQQTTRVSQAQPTQTTQQTSQNKKSISQGHGGASGDVATHVAGQHLIVFVNTLQETIWLAAASNSGSILLPTTGWELAANASLTVSIPDAWAGRFWGRTGCVFDTNGNGRCETGDCGNHFQCGGTVTGVPPATLAEFNMNADQGQDVYDVSMVDGSNLPLYINSFGQGQSDPISANGCSNAGCTRDVNATCPEELRVLGSTGNVVGCLSACAKFGSPMYCCAGDVFSNPSQCNPAQWPVNYAKIFKDAEPFAYSYAYDDRTSLFYCVDCNYKITFGVSST